MIKFKSTVNLTACAVAASLFLSGCGGGDASGTKDTTPPTVAITDNVSADVATGKVTFTFTFSEDVGTSFVVEDLVVTGGTAGALVKSSATVYTLDVTPASNASGTISVAVAAAKFKDIANNDNTVAVTASQAFNTADSASTVLASFDETPALAFVGFNGAEGTTVGAAPTGGGSGNAIKVLRTGGDPWAGAFITTAGIPFTATKNVVTAKVYSPKAGVPIKMKMEDATGNATAEISAGTAVVSGWQTLTWTFTGVDLTKSYTKIVLLPDLGTVSPVSGDAYYFDDITLGAAAAPVVVPASNTLATFDETPALAFVGFNGAEGTTVGAAPTGGGSGNAIKVLRTGGDPWAGAFITTAGIPFTATKNVVTAKVYSPKAGVPIKMKMEDATGNATAEISAGTAVVSGWQTLTWTFTGVDLTKSYTKIVLLPDLGTVSPVSGDAYYFDDITLGAAASSGGTGTVTPAGLVSLTNGVYASNYAETPTPWKSVEGGTAGSYVDDSVGPKSWWSGLAAGDATPSFYFGYGLPSATKAWGFGAYVNAPNNGTANVAPYTNLVAAVWGNDDLMKKGPTITVILRGPDVGGCAAELVGSLTARGIGVQSYTLPLSGFTVQKACAYTSASQILTAGVAQIHYQVLGANAQYTVQGDPGYYANGLNIGPIKFN